jgi:hypothetical protein
MRESKWVFDEFNREFEDMIPKFKTQKATYEAVERIHEQDTGSRKYSDYESFRITRSNKQKKKRNRVT